jgi:hypothetical protein
MSQQILIHPLGFRQRYSTALGRFVQRLLEAWWVLTGRWTLHRAWQAGHDHGTSMEQQRQLRGGR